MTNDIVTSSFDDMHWTWANTGYVDPRLPAEAKSAMRFVDYEIHLEDKAYTNLFNHLVNDHGEAGWHLEGSETYALNGGPPFTLTTHHSALHDAGADHAHGDEAA